MNPPPVTVVGCRGGAVDGGTPDVTTGSVLVVAAWTTVVVVAVVAGATVVVVVVVPPAPVVVVVVVGVDPIGAPLASIVKASPPEQHSL